MIEPVQAQGLLRWPGFVPNDQAMPVGDGALAGLSLLQDEPNFRHSLPTKVVEYMARGVPVVTTPLGPVRVWVRGAVRQLPGGGPGWPGLVGPAA